MLNELNQLADALERENIPTYYWQPDFGKLPNQSCLRILVADNGLIEGIEELSNELKKNLRKWEPSGNGLSFPGLNIPQLYRIADEGKKKMIKKWKDGKEQTDIKLLKEWVASATKNWPFDESKLEKSLKIFPEEMNSIIGEVPKDFDSIKTLIFYLNKFQWNTKKGSVSNEHIFTLFSAIEQYIWKELENGGNVPVLLSMLIYEGNAKKNPEKDRGQVSVYFDVKEWNEYPVASKDMMIFINDCLLVDEEKTIKRSNSDDAFAKPLDGSERLLPTIELPIIGDVKLRAMFGAWKCQTRYGIADALSFPVGQETRKRTKGALEWLGDESSEGETWGRADEKELLFAYPAILQKKPDKLVSIFGARKIDDSEVRFADCAKEVIDALKGISSDLKSLDLRVFSLKKMDTTSSKTKVVFQRNYTAQRLVDAAKDWQNGAENIPEILLKVWGENKLPLSSTPIVPFPLQVSACLNRFWKMDGTYVKTIKGDDKPLIPSSQGIDLLLDENPERFVPYLMSLLIKNTKGLLLFIGNHRMQLDNKGKPNIFSVSDKKKYEHHKLLIPSIYGLLLYKLNIRKDAYMKESPFLVGRMLKLADELHALYCEIVRENKLPPQLIGNALIVTALESPEQAIAQLYRRMAHYIGWAKQYRSKDESKSWVAGDLLMQFEEAVTQMKGVSFSKRQTDTERAQQFIGYLASNTK
ncbi:MAG TPA: hypothetical protein DF296_13545 [Candidatus Margulisbacteria bacterium]|nr:MAG: hypothetical protein A2X41_11820 [Candidatus Margulisbacteria bacterium GWE2_39_32]HCT86210.1 hypothetical protein [Candidatus Margulisiibacteriota bacterium]